MHLFYFLFLIEILIAVVAYTNVAEYAYMPVKVRTVRILSERRKIIYLMAALGVMLVCHAFRDPLSLEDTPYYVRAFQEAKLMPMADVISKGYEELKTETGFAVLLKVVTYVFPYTQMLFVLTSAFMFLSFYVTIKRYSPIFWFSVFVLMIDSFPQSLFVLRGFLALSVLLFSIPYIINRKIIPYLLLCLLASSVHTTSIVFLPVFFLYGIKDARLLTLFLALSGIILIIGFDIILPYIVEAFLSEYLVYIVNADNYEGGNWKMPALLLAILVFRIVVMREHFFEQGINRLCSVVLVLAFLFYFAGLGYGLIGRISLYFSNFTFLILPNTVQYIRSKSLQFSVCMVYTLFTGFFFLKSASGIFWIDYQLISI